jgi:hypothetical protein
VRTSRVVELGEEPRENNMLTTKVALLTVLAVLFITTACGDSDDEDDKSNQTTNVTSPSKSPCENWTAIGKALSCTGTNACPEIPATCTEATNQWLSCVASDLAQCQCEPDGDLNCEGSFKNDEGPAKCVAEYQAVDACRRND